jgi:DNA-binding transcriptional MerR regulator
MPARPHTTFSITALSAEFAISTRAIRFYEDQGLISPARKGEGEQARRVYGLRERTRIKLILRGKRLGMSLQEIKDLFDLYDADKSERSQLEKFIAILADRQAHLEQQRLDIDASLLEINEVAQNCARLLKKVQHGTAI